jgi:hypothetical protein
MKKTFPFILVLTARTLFAETVVQPADFSASNEGNLYNGFGNQALVTNDFFTATFQPFNPSLGTLQSFTIQCEIGGLLSGTIGGDGDEGSANASLGGTLSLGGIAFNGTGGGNNGVGSTGEPIEVNFAIPTFEQTLTAANAGVTYHPGLLTTVTGTEPFPLSFSMPPQTNSTVMVGYANVADLAASVSSTITLTYTYETPSGAVETLKITSIVRNAAQETVAIEWTSAAGKTYAVEAWDGTGSWSTIAPTVSGGTFTEENVPPTVPRRFYRVREND